MNLVFDDHGACYRAIGLVNDQLVGGLQRDVADIAFERGHQVAAPGDDTRPAGKIIEHFVDNVIGDDIEEMVAVDESAQRREPDRSKRRRVRRLRISRTAQQSLKHGLS
jgi:hypothetical protein